jgi:magnesium-transporting ATPase (P-type)
LSRITTHKSTGGITEWGQLHRQPLSNAACGGGASSSIAAEPAIDEPPRHRGERRSQGSTMTQRTRKLVGTIVLFAFVTVYALVISVIAGFMQVRSSKVAEVLFYAIGGLAWVIPAAILIRWMQRPDAPRNDT